MQTRRFCPSPVGYEAAAAAAALTVGGVVHPAPPFHRHEADPQGATVQLAAVECPDGFGRVFAVGVLHETEPFGGDLKKKYACK